MPTKQPGAAPGVGTAAHANSLSMPNGRCRLHGGKSTGPITCEGLERSRRANWRHGHYSAKAKHERLQARIEMANLRKVLKQFGEEY